MPTALELSREEWKQYVEAASRRSRFSGERGEEDKAHGQLMAKVVEAATMLKTRFFAKRVVLFGSLAHSQWFLPDSDVDIAVEGLDPEDYWRAWRMVEEIIEDRPVDLIDVREASETLRRAIDRYGVEL